MIKLFLKNYIPHLLEILIPNLFLQIASFTRVSVPNFIKIGLFRQRVLSLNTPTQEHTYVYSIICWKMFVLTYVHIYVWTLLPLRVWFLGSLDPPFIEHSCTFFCSVALISRAMMLESKNLSENRKNVGLIHLVLMITN